MTDSEKLDLILQKMQGMNQEIHSLSSQVQDINERLDGLEFQIKSTERVLKNQITKSESLILDEVERVHNILDKHTHDQSKHTA